MVHVKGVGQLCVDVCHEVSEPWCCESKMAEFVGKFLHL